MRKKPQTSKKKMSPKNKRIINILLAVLFTGLLTFVIVAGYVINNMVTLVNGDRIIDLQYYRENQDQTTIIYAKNSSGEFEELTKLHGEKNRVWVDRESMSEWLGKAFVALEDKRFYEHEGVDWYSSTLGIINSAVKSGDVRGGSTITQQLIKNLTGENGRNLNRKYNEMISALNLERYYEKDDILEAYLNTIFLSHNCYGVQTAAETYFGKDVSELNLAECASIAGITQYPAKYDPLWNPDKNKERQEHCLKMMLEQEIITEEEYEEAVNYELIFTNSDNYVADKDEEDDKIESATENNVQSYYVDYVVASVIADLKESGYSHYEATNLIYSGGLHIYAAVDTEAQKIAEDVYVHRSGFPSESVNEASELSQSAMTIMDYSGRIVALVGGAGEKTENRSNNRAVSAIRHAGSSIKPLSIYAPAIEEDVITWSSKITNYAIQWKGNLWPENYGGSLGDPDSAVTAQYAVAISYNTVPARILLKHGLGFETSYDYLKNHFHISTYNDSVDSVSPSALVTGGSNGGVTTLQMAAAFASFGNGGKYFEPYCYYEVKDNKGEVILKNEPQGEQVISPETAYVMNQMLQTVFYGSGGTGRGYAVENFRTFGKTGTSTSNNDRWIVGGTPYYISAVWFGYDYNKEIKASGNPAGQIFETIMNRIHAGLEKKSFEKYTDKVVQRTYCTGSGLLAGENCSSTASGWYKTSNLPKTCTNCNAGSSNPGEETDVPNTPETPTNPGTSENPTTPEVPTIPGAPEIPSIPNMPEVPNLPEIPGMPEVPSA